MRGFKQSQRERDIEGIIRMILECSDDHATGRAASIAEALRAPGTVYHHMIDRMSFHPDNAKQICDVLRIIGYDIPHHEGGFPDRIPTKRELQSFIADAEGCPRCGIGSYPQGVATDHPSDGWAHYEFTCSRCNLEWLENYKLHSIERIRSEAGEDWIDPEKREPW